MTSAGDSMVQACGGRAGDCAEGERGAGSEGGAEGGASSSRTDGRSTSQASATISATHSRNRDAGNTGMPHTVASRSHSPSSGKLNSTQPPANSATRRWEPSPLCTAVSRREVSTPPCTALCARHLPRSYLPSGAVRLWVLLLAPSWAWRCCRGPGARAQNSEKTCTRSCCPQWPSRCCNPAGRGPR